MSNNKGHAINSGGADRDRTDDLLHAMQALFQLSYGPSDNRRTKRQQSAGLASENLRQGGMAEFYVQSCSHSDPGAALPVFREVPISHEAHNLGCSGTSNPTLGKNL